MAELTAADVTTFTGGRLPNDGPTGNTQRMLDAALQVARHETGWPVSPVQTGVTLTLNGPGSRILPLPTMKMVALTGVTEDDVDLDVSTIAISAPGYPGMPEQVRLRKRSGGWWSCEYSSIVVEMSHGFTEAEAADWRQAILSMVDQMSLIPVKAATGMSDFGQRSWRVDDVQVAYSPYAAMAEEVMFSAASIIDKYRLPAVEFI